MFPSRLLLPSINKWVALTATGISSAAGYGVRELGNQPLQGTKRLFSPRILLSNNNRLGLKEEINVSTTPSPETIPAPKPEIPILIKVSPTPIPIVKPTPIAPKVKKIPKVTITTAPKASTKKPTPAPEKYQIDQAGLQSSTHHSMAYKYKDYLLLVKQNHPAGQTKSTKLKTMARKSGEKKFGTYGRGYMEEKYLTPLFVHKFCQEALSYSEWTTLGTIGINKKYMDFLGSMCGREDKSKPKDGGYRD